MTVDSDARLKSLTTTHSYYRSFARETTGDRRITLTKPAMQNECSCHDVSKHKLFYSSSSMGLSCLIMPYYEKFNICIVWIISLCTHSCVIVRCLFIKITWVHDQFGLHSVYINKVKLTYTLSITRKSSRHYTLAKPVVEKWCISNLCLCSIDLWLCPHHRFVRSLFTNITWITNDIPWLLCGNECVIITVTS